MPRTRVEVKDEDGRTVKDEGVLVGEILKRAGATLGGDLRGNAMTTYVLASASDGYQVLFSLAELDPAFAGRRSSSPTPSTANRSSPTRGRSGWCRRGTRARRDPSGCCSAWTSSASRSSDVGTRAIAVALFCAALASSRLPAQAAYKWALPAGFPPPPVPADNPMSEAKVSLGRHLFYDTRLSGNGTQSCATCHEQSRAFTDGRRAKRRVHRRGASSRQHEPGQRGLRASADVGQPVVHAPRGSGAGADVRRHPIELGLDGRIRGSDRRAGATYQRCSAPPSTRRADSRDNIVKAIAAFERSIVSARSPYDRYHFDRDEAAISERRNAARCCFTAVRFPASPATAGSTSRTRWARRGVPWRWSSTTPGCTTCRGLLSYPTENAGVFDITRNAADVGKFKAPTLRNIAVTAPYMHDGSVATLEEAIDHYAAGGRTIASGPNAGVGRDNPNKSRCDSRLHADAGTARGPDGVPAVADRRGTAAGSRSPIPGCANQTVDHVGSNPPCRSAIRTFSFVSNGWRTTYATGRRRSLRG